MFFPRSLLLVLCLVGSSLLLSACANHAWRIQLRDGRQFRAISRPELSTKTGYYRYQNEHGRDALLRADEVLLVEQIR